MSSVKSRRDCAFEVISRLDQCRNLDEITDLFGKFSSVYGADRTIGGFLEINTMSSGTIRPALLWNEHPPELKGVYFDEKLHRFDPILKKIMATTNDSFDWTELELGIAGDIEAINVLGRLREFGVRAGHTAVWAPSADERQFVSLNSGESLRIGKEDRELIRAVGLRALSHARAMADAREAIGLSERQVKVLQLAAEGLTDDDIAREMGITRQGAIKQMRAIKTKLDARNRTHAVMIALRAKLFR